MGKLPGTVIASLENDALISATPCCNPRIPDKTAHECITGEKKPPSAVLPPHEGKESQNFVNASELAKQKHRRENAEVQYADDSN